MRQHMHMPRFINNARIFTTLLIVVLVVLVARGCNFNLPLTATQKAAEMADLAEQQARWAEARQDRAQRAPFDLVMYFLSRLVGLALVVAAVAGAISVFSLRGIRWAATIKPVGGIFPIVLGRLGGTWRIHDPNRQVAATTRLNDGHGLLPNGWEGAQLATTAAALDVQKEQARGYSVQAATPAGQAPAALAPAGEPAPVQWPKSVSLSDLVQRQGGASLDKIILGVSPGDAGEWELVNPPMSRMVHVGIGAASGWGKSTLLHSILAQFVMAGGVGLALADASGNALGQWRDCDLLQWPLATESDEITALFVEMGKELDRRADLYTQAGNPNSLVDYNSRRGELPALEPLSLVADEANSILKTNAAGSAAAESLAYRGRKFGLWLVLSGQRWTKDEIPVGLKNQLSTRVGFKMNSKAQSNNLLMSSDAASLNDVGRGIAIIPGRSSVEFQAPLFTDDEITALLTGQTGARSPAPVIVQDATPVKVKPVAKLTANQEERALELAEKDMSTTGILKDIFGPNGKSGPRARAINQLLDR